MDIFKEYVAMWKNYINFSDRTTVRGYWMAFLWNFIAGLIVGTLAAVLKFSLLSYLYSLAIFLPSLAICVRRLRDMGKSWTTLFFLLIPIVGPILVIVWLCQPAIPADETPVV